MSSAAVWTMLAVAGAGTFAIRAVPMAMADRLTTLPTVARRSLRMIPPAVLSALVALDVFRPEGELELVGARTAAAIVGGLVAWRTRNVVATLVVGVTVLAVLD